jgi:hypothetical protein
MLEVEVRGLGALMARLDYERLVGRPLDEEVRDKVQERWMRRRRKGEGARNNELSARVSNDGASLTVETTLRNPRRTGSAWQRALYAAARAMIPRVLRSAIRKIEKGWAG